MIRLAPGADQLAIGTAVRQALAGADPLAVSDVWNRLGTVGLTGALLREDEGGMGLTACDVIVGLVETGRACVPVPLVETALVAAELLTGTQHAPLLSAGTAWVTVAADPAGPVAWPEGADGVPAGGVLAVDRDGGAAVVRWLPSSSEPAEPVTALDPGRPLGRVRTGTGDVVCDDPVRIARALRAGTLGTAAQLIGLAERSLELAVAYTAQRTQFGTPIGGFQAVKHRLADALVAVDLARPLVWAAAWAHSHDTSTAVRDVAAAKLRAGEAAALAARAALQCHGGMGYTREHELHRWLLRSWALRAAWGTPGELTATLAAELGMAGPESFRSRPGAHEERVTADV